MRDDVTVLAYHFWDDDGYDEAFSRLAFAFGAKPRHFALVGLQ